MGGKTNIRFVLFSELPKGIDQEILARVSPEDLVNKCKFVCRNWRDIISGSDFARKNFLLTKSRSQKLIMGRSHYNYAGKLTDITREVSSGGSSCKYHNIELCKSGQVRSSCNGLILVNDKKESDGTFQVMNLLTRACVTIPRSETGCNHRRSRCAVGFGYDPVTQAYKVVHLYVFSLGFEVFTLNSCPKEEKWRFIHPGPWPETYVDGSEIVREVLDNTDAVRTGNFLHWSIGTGNYIVSFDVSDERKSFKTKFPVEIFQSDWDSEKNHYRFSLTDINGDLGFLHNVSSSQIDVYTLDHQRIWSKKHSISRVRDVLSRSDPEMWRLVGVCSLRDGQVLVLEYESSSCLYVYDSRRPGVPMQKLGMNKKTDTGFAYTPHITSLLHWTHLV